MPVATCARWKAARYSGSTVLIRSCRNARVDALDLPRVGEVALGQALQQAVAARLREERVEFVAQLPLQRRDRPREVALGADGKADVVVEEDVARRGGVDGRHDGVVDDALGHLRDQRFRRVQGHRLPLDLRMLAPDLGISDVSMPVPSTYPTVAPARSFQSFGLKPSVV